jgi:hypothetical protein
MWDSPALGSTAGVPDPDPRRTPESNQTDRNGFPSKHPPRHVPSARWSTSRRRSPPAALGKVLPVRFLIFYSGEITIACFHPLNHPPVSTLSGSSGRRPVPTGQRSRTSRVSSTSSSLLESAWLCGTSWPSGSSRTLYVARVWQTAMHRHITLSFFMHHFMNDSSISGARVPVGSQPEHQCQISDQPELAGTQASLVVMSRGTES